MKTIRCTRLNTRAADNIGSRHEIFSDGSWLYQDSWNALYKNLSCLGSEENMPTPSISSTLTDCSDYLTADEAFRQRQYDERCIALRYQPIIDYREQKVVCLEALLDWRKLSDPNIDTEAFVAEIERNPQLSLNLDTFILKTALRDYREINALTGYCGAITVNVSPTTLLSNSFRSMAIRGIRALTLNQPKGELINSLTRDLLNKSEGAPSSDSPALVLEVSERQPWASNQQILKAIKNLHLNGVFVAVDDFIRGYANFDVLLSDDVHVVKVDKVISSYLLENAKVKIFAEQFWQLATQLQKQIIVEGIEDVEQLLYLKDIGYNYFQGYYFCPPTNIPGIARFISDLTSRR